MMPTMITIAFLFVRMLWDSSKSGRRLAIPRSMLKEVFV
jgi:hypothetical protein